MFFQTSKLAAKMLLLQVQVKLAVELELSSEFCLEVAETDLEVAGRQ